MVTRSEPGYAWDFCGGHAAVDFTNTVGSRGETPAEHFNTFGDVISWAETRGIVGRAQARRLRVRAERHPGAMDDALTEVVGLRESLYRLIAAAARGRTAPAADLALVNAHVARAFTRPHLAARGGHLALAFDAPGATPLAAPIVTPIVRAAIDLVTTDTIERVGLCADESCRWLFVDATRNRTRRWCTMKDCGNRSKVRRFRERA
jgi:predicted RNA-binding Zn ribbon-like protein